ncbi:MAG: hypothetical protein WCC64_22725 [Aliidongia sp.]
MSAALRVPILQQEAIRRTIQRGWRRRSRDIENTEAGGDEAGTDTFQAVRRQILLPPLDAGPVNGRWIGAGTWPQYGRFNTSFSLQGTD